MNKIITEQNKRAGAGFLTDSAEEQGIFGGVVRKFDILFSSSFMLKLNKINLFSKKNDFRERKIDKIIELGKLKLS